jgi:hypothetical protein
MTRTPAATIITGRGVDRDPGLPGLFPVQMGVIESVERASAELAGTVPVPRELS